ncbi:MAG: glycosyltransferase family 4 protein [Chitinophagaceae bacterium]|nr:glycosyltransferase family 4 protein [Chitinophagaceae bacterium]
MTQPNVLFITLRTFSLTGGIEKVCRGIGHALQQMQDKGNIKFNMHSFYDTDTDERYVVRNNFRGFNGNRSKALYSSIKNGLKADIVILSHINLSPAGLAIKMLSPKTKVILWSHGIEIWRELNWIKRRFLMATDRIVAVSRFTAGTLTKMHHVNAAKVQAIPNGLDPYFNIPNLEDEKLKSESNKLKLSLLDNKKLSLQTKVFMALTRLGITEKNKNYDKVIRLLGELKEEGNEAVYILCGKYNKEEYSRIMSIAKESGMENNILLPGFISDEELPLYYRFADAFVLPSTKEGFGLAFIEAQACGLSVLCGNLDGSIEAVRTKEAGISVDPNNNIAIKAALEEMINRTMPTKEKITIQNQCVENFSFKTYSKNIKTLIEELSSVN